MACATIASVGGAFPQMRAAVPSKMGCGYLRAHIEDFPAVVLAEAVAELRSQMGANGILRESARAAASGAGEGGALAADNLGSAFDSEAAAAIMMGDVTVDLTPEEVVLGVLPCSPWPSLCGSASTTRRPPRLVRRRPCPRPRPVPRRLLRAPTGLSCLLASILRRPRSARGLRCRPGRPRHRSSRRCLPVAP